MAGGKDGKKGHNLLVRESGGTINLGSKQSYDVKPGVSNLLPPTTNTHPLSISSITLFDNYQTVYPQLL